MTDKTEVHDLSNYRYRTTVRNMLGEIELSKHVSGTRLRTVLREVCYKYIDRFANVEASFPSFIENVIRDHGYPILGAGRKLELELMVLN